MDFSEKSGADKDPQDAVDFADSSAVAVLAQSYQKEQADKGITVSITQAVAHVTAGKK